MDYFKSEADKLIFALSETDGKNKNAFDRFW